jgi:hypothetical protein
MNLTIAKVRAFTKRALRDSDLEAEIESIEWIGQRSKAVHSNKEFRVARVVLKLDDGRRVGKLATITSTNGFTIR